MKKLIWGIVIVVVIFVGYQFVYKPMKAWQTPALQENNAVPTTNNTPVASPTPTTEKKTTSTSVSGTVVSPAPMKGAPDTSSWKTYTDMNLKVSIKYPTDWSYSDGGNVYPHAFWVWKQYSPESTNIVRIAQADGCRVDKEIEVAGQKAYDSGWRSADHPTRTVCIVDKKYSITFTAVDEPSRINEDAILSSLTFTN